MVVRREWTSTPTLNETRWRIMNLIQSGAASQAMEMAEALHMSQQAITKHLRAMFQDGIVAPDPSWGLARPVRWILTERGLRLQTIARERGSREGK